MALTLHADRGRRFLLLLTGSTILLHLLPVQAARAPTDTIHISGNSQKTNVNGGTMHIDDVQLRQAPDTVINADSGDGSQLNNGADNGRWKLTGKVHIEYQSTILDADTAVVVFADGRIQSIEVHGKPARFSHPAKNDGARDQGTAEMITYDADTHRMRFTGHTWYSIGPVEGTADKPLVYDLDTTEIFTENTDNTDHSRVNMTVSPKQRVPTPRTPDRSTAE